MSDNLVRPVYRLVSNEPQPIPMARPRSGGIVFVSAKRREQKENAR